MYQTGDRIFIAQPDIGIDGLFDGSRPPPTAVMYFSHNEELFLRLAEPVEIPSFPIHHDVRKKSIPPALAEVTDLSLRRIARHIPWVFEGLHYFFDSGEILRPSFFQILKLEDSFYVYFLKIDLSYRPSTHTVVKPGTNDYSPVYVTDMVFFEADLVPLREYEQISKGELSLHIAQAVSETWIGETGRGYFVQGIWLDRELTKFFSKLFIPEGKRLYPYFPLNCKYRAVCMQPYDISAAGRRQSVVVLHRSRKIIERNIRDIENALRQGSFSEDGSSFKRLKAEIPEAQRQPFSGLTVQAYLNSQDMKEYQLVVS